MPVYVAPPTACERLSDMLPRFGGTLEPQARTSIARLPGGRVFGAGAVLAPDGSSLARDVSADFGKPYDQHWLLTYTKIPPPVRVEGTTAVVAVTLGDGYYHWLLEELPRLLTVEKGSCDAMIAHTRPAFIREALAFAGRRERFIEAARYSHFECKNLVIPGLIGEPGIPSAGAVEMLNAFVAPLRFSATGSLGERLYITRQNARRRRVQNEEALWRELEARGFVKIAAEALSWREQINAFAHAKVIVAPHGAGLANLAFCPQGARVVEFFNGAYVNRCFEHLAAIACLDYRAVVGRGPAETSDLPPNQQDVVVAPSAILDALIDF